MRLVSELRQCLFSSRPFLLVARTEPSRLLSHLLQDDAAGGRGALSGQTHIVNPVFSPKGSFTRDKTQCLDPHLWFHTRQKSCVCSYILCSFRLWVTKIFNPPSHKSCVCRKSCVFSGSGVAAICPMQWLILMPPSHRPCLQDILCSFRLWVTR